jgi:hypothetical protein
MHTEIRNTQPRANTASRRVDPHLRLIDRLAIAALVTALNVWIGMARFHPGRHWS